MIGCNCVSFIAVPTQNWKSLLKTTHMQKTQQSVTKRQGRKIINEIFTMSVKQSHMCHCWKWPIQYSKAPEKASLKQAL